MRPNRPKINPKLRSAIFRKHNGRCYYCGCKLTSAHNFELDHYIPFTADGKSDFSNLVPSCNLCNKIKSCHTISEFRKKLETMIEKNDQLGDKLRNKYKFDGTSTINFYYERQPEEVSIL